MQSLYGNQVQSTQPTLDGYSKYSYLIVNGARWHVRILHNLKDDSYGIDFGYCSATGKFLSAFSGMDKSKLTYYVKKMVDDSSFAALQGRYWHFQLHNAS